MNKGLKNLPRKKLQAFIGEDLLSRLEELLPTITNNRIDNTTIYRKENLATIVDAFGGEKFLTDSTHRWELLLHQPPEIIDQIINKANLNTIEDNFEEKINTIVRQGWSDRTFALTVLNELNLSASNAPAEINEAPSFEVLSPPLSPFKSLKDFQLSVYQEAQKRLEAPRNRFIIQMPTGSGKTRTAMEIICNFLNESKKGSLIIWLAHSSELCEQAYTAFKEIWEHIGRHEVILGRMWGQHSFTDIDPSYRGFIVAGFQKTYSLKQKKNNLLENLQNRAGLIIVDEAHKAIAPTYETAIRKIKNENTSIIGLTATPGRSAIEFEQNRKLAEFFFGKVVEIPTPQDENVITYLRSMKVLAEAHFEPLITNITFSLNSEEKKAVERFFDFPNGFLQRVADDDVRNIEIIKRVENEIEKGHRILLFACSVEHSKFLCGCFNFLGISAGHVDGEIGYNRRSSLINAFKTGRIQILTNYGVLSTGFDVPQVDVIFIARPTASVVLYSQMLGRGLRGPAIGGTDSCKVVDVIDNIEDYSDAERVYEFFDDFWSH